MARGRSTALPRKPTIDVPEIFMKITLSNDGVAFQALSETGQQILMDGSPQVGGQGLGMRPMQVVLAAMGGCSGIDIVTILRKQRENFTGFSMEIESVSAPNKSHTEWRELHAIVSIDGDLAVEKALQACHKSFAKYCSVSKLLEHTATITFSLTINGSTVAQRVVPRMP
jgi:putative redox protein